MKMLNEHDFSTDAAAEDFTKEYDFLESKVPDNADGRGHIFFVRVIVSAVMKYSTEGNSINNSNFEVNIKIQWMAQTSP